jgi:hypothetical protein
MTKKQLQIRTWNLQQYIYIWRRSKTEIFGFNIAFPWIVSGFFLLLYTQQKELKKGTLVNELKNQLDAT